MKQREPVSHIMSTDLYTVQANQSLLEVRDLFNAHRVRHLPVVSGNKIIGLISYTDFMRITYGGGTAENQVNEAIYHTLKLDQVMSSHLVTVEPSTPIKEVAEIFVEKEFHALPVVENGVLKGLVTTTDVIRFMLEQY